MFPLLEITSSSPLQSSTYNMAIFHGRQSPAGKTSDVYSTVVLYSYCERNRLKGLNVNSLPLSTEDNERSSVAFVKQSPGYRYREGKKWYWQHACTVCIVCFRLCDSSFLLQHHSIPTPRARIIKKDRFFRGQRGLTGLLLVLEQRFVCATATSAALSSPLKLQGSPEVFTEGPQSSVSRAISSASCVVFLYKHVEYLFPACAGSLWYSAPNFALQVASVFPGLCLSHVFNHHGGEKTRDKHCTFTRNV